MTQSGYHLGGLTHLLFIEEWLGEHDEVLYFMESVAYSPHLKTTKSCRGTTFLTHRGVIFMTGSKQRFGFEFYPFKTITKLLIHLQENGKLEDYPHLAIFVGQEAHFEILIECSDVERFVEFKQLLSNKACGKGMREEWTSKSIR